MEPTALSFLSRPRRPRRAREWSPERAVTFIVTLAATRSVTLAARAAGMSRKSAYALRGRDAAFASAWLAAVRAAAPRLVQGDKVDKVDRPPTPPRQGNTLLARLACDEAFAGFGPTSRDSAPLAPRGRAQ